MRWLIFLLPIFLFGHTFQDHLLKSEVGDYVVFEQKGLLTLLSIHSRSNDKIIIEEISLPSHKRPKNFHTFVQSGAPKATSHLLYELDLSTGTFLECYSFTKGTFMVPPALFKALLSLPLEKSPHPKRIGTPPLPGAPDNRRLWSPPITFEGQTERPTDFSVFTTYWPDDNSEFAGCRITLYFIPQLPFPVHLEFEDGRTHTFKLRTALSGKGISSAKVQMPRRYPSFIGGLIKQENSCALKLTSPSYYTTFSLESLDLASGETKELHANIDRVGNELTFTFSNNDLIPGHSYTFLATPQDYPQYSAESKLVQY